MQRVEVEPGLTQRIKCPCRVQGIEADERHKIVIAAAKGWDRKLIELNKLPVTDELRAEFDLVDRYQALELKLRSVQEALELVLDVARDRRLVLLEGAVVLLIVLEVVLSVLRLH